MPKPPKFEDSPDTIPMADDASWQDWENAVHWNLPTIPGILVEEGDTAPLPLELVPIEVVPLREGTKFFT